MVLYEQRSTLTALTSQQRVSGVCTGHCSSTPTAFTNLAVNEERNTCKINIEGLTHQYTMSYMYSC